MIKKEHREKMKQRHREKSNETKNKDIIQLIVKIM